MQKRFWVSTHYNIQDAYAAKTAALKAQPDDVFQVRKGRDGAREVFRLVQRLTTREAVAVINEKEKQYTKKKRERRVRRPANAV